MKKSGLLFLLGAFLVQPLHALPEAINVGNRLRLMVSKLTPSQWKKVQAQSGLDKKTVVKISQQELSPSEAESVLSKIKLGWLENAPRTITERVLSIVFPGRECQPLRDYEQTRINLKSVESNLALIVFRNGEYQYKDRAAHRKFDYHKRYKTHIWTFEDENVKALKGGYFRALLHASDIYADKMHKRLLYMKETYSNRLKEMEQQSAMVKKFAQTGDRSGCKISSLVQKEGTWSPERAFAKAGVVVVLFLSLIVSGLMIEAGGV